MKVGQTARVTKTKSYQGRDSYSIPTVNRKSRVYALTENIIVLEYLKDDKPTVRESFNIADIIEKVVKIEVKQGKEWIEVDKSYFK